MDTALWRPWARVVAVLEMILGVTSMFAILVWNFEEAYQATKDCDEASASWGNFFAYLGAHLISASYLILTIIFVCSFFQFTSAIQLWKATDAEKSDINKAMMRTDYWRDANIILLIITVICFMIKGNYIIGVIDLLVQGGLIYVVYRYLRELDIMLSQSPRP